KQSDTDSIKKLAAENIWGPWLDTTWNQGISGYYNDSFPDDPNTEPGKRYEDDTWTGGSTDGRVLVGCGPVAFGQIVNYWEYPNSISFDDSDEFTSRYNPGDGKGERVIQIDSDHQELNFSSFSELNSRLSNIDYSGSEQEVSDLLFALSIILEAQYSDASTSSYVGTEYFEGKLGYQNAEELTSDNNTFYDELEFDMRRGFPALLNIEEVKDGEKVSGHYIVADGYKDTGKYHLNFGWGPNQPDDISEAWYSLPDGMPAGYNVVDRAIMDIQPPEITSDTEAVFRVTKGGMVYADGTYYGEGFSSGYADLAEKVKVTEEVEPGDVLALDPTEPKHYRKSQKPYSNMAAGVVSTQPGMTLGNDDTSAKAIMALMGTVPVKATTENGPIKPGDLLTTSSDPGRVMVCNDTARCTGSIIGKALEYLEEGEGKIKILLAS
ncbi:C10 family peptidase, partial [Candidatus Bipolaricaulota bacterium]|nr:C10 family peptidase [Candidatus Bipolaricaulota bacterium]